MYIFLLLQKFAVLCYIRQSSLPAMNPLHIFCSEQVFISLTFSNNFFTVYENFCWKWFFIFIFCQQFGDTPPLSSVLPSFWRVSHGYSDPCPSVPIVSFLGVHFGVFLSVIGVQQSVCMWLCMGFLLFFCLTLWTSLSLELWS